MAQKKAKRSYKKHPLRNEAQKERVMELMLKGKLSMNAVAEEVGVAVSTVWKWRRDPGFRDEWEKRSQELKDRAQTRLVALVDKAIDAVDQLLDGKHDAKAGDRLAAAREVLNRVPGLERRERHTLDGHVTIEDPFADRSEDDLDHYARTGYWPEEAPDGTSAKPRPTED